MQNTTEVKRLARNTVALAAQVPEEYAAEFEVIQKQRGDQFMSDTMRAALEEFRRRHWEEQLTKGAAGRPWTG